MSVELGNRLIIAFCRDKCDDMSLLLFVICGSFLCQPTVHGSLSKTAFSVQAGRGNDDYWSEDFDKNKNCEQEEKITKLINEVGMPSKIVFCASQVNRKSFTILQANDGTDAPSQCSIEQVSFLNDHT